MKSFLYSTYCLIKSWSSGLARTCTSDIVDLYYHQQVDSQPTTWGFQLEQRRTASQIHRSLFPLKKLNPDVFFFLFMSEWISMRLPNLMTQMSKFFLSKFNVAELVPIIATLIKMYSHNTIIITLSLMFYLNKVFKNMLNCKKKTFKKMSKRKNSILIYLIRMSYRNRAILINRRQSTMWQ